MSYLLDNNLLSFNSGTTYIGQWDYISGPYNVTFPAGFTRATFNIALIDDNEQEDSETFMLTISEDLLPTCAFVSNYNRQSRVTIVDNDDDNNYCE